MSTRHIADEDILQVIGCELDKRPAAPTIDELAPLMLGVARSPGELTVRFPLEARHTIDAFAAAERLCCGGIDWQVKTGQDVTLQIGADELVLDAIAQMFPSNQIEMA